MTNIFNVLLLCVTAFGGALLFRIRDDVASLRAERAQLSAKYAAFTVEELSLHSFVRVETGDPYTFAWRGYYPGGRRATRFGSAWSLPYAFSERRFPASEYTLRLQLRLTDRYLEASFSDSLRLAASERGRGDHELRVLGSLTGGMVSFLKDNWHRLEFVVSPVGEVRQAKADAVNVLLQIHLPRDMRDELEAATNSATAAELMQEPLFYLLAGPEAGLDKLVPTTSFYPQMPPVVRPKR